MWYLKLTHIHVHMCYLKLTHMHMHTHENTSCVNDLFYNLVYLVLCRFKYHLSSDCWADYRDDEGNIVPDKSRFPE